MNKIKPIILLSYFFYESCSNYIPDTLALQMYALKVDRLKNGPKRGDKKEFDNRFCNLMAMHKNITKEHSNSICANEKKNKTLFSGLLDFEQIKKNFLILKDIIDEGFKDKNNYDIRNFAEIMCVSQTVFVGIFYFFSCLDDSIFRDVFITIANLLGTLAPKYIAPILYKFEEILKSINFKPQKAFYEIIDIFKEQVEPNVTSETLSYYIDIKKILEEMPKDKLSLMVLKLLGVIIFLNQKNNCYASFDETPYYKGIKKSKHKN